jgi:pantoate--beta-alanine ligase
MRTVKTVGAMQRLGKRWQRDGVRVGFVPTMGFLHAGHLSLVRRARKLVGPAGRVVLSIYVNPMQFAPTEDLDAYPRDFARDAKLCREEGVDVLFAPDSQEMYPERPEAAFSTAVVEEQLSKLMEGTTRPTHFRGVTTVVAKLFNIVLPEVAVFGAKDFQQAAIIRRMVRDLNFPLKVVVAPTQREVDGLAMSSRNKYLLGDQRRQALILSRCLGETQAKVRREHALSAESLRAQIAAEVATEPQARLDYVEFFDPETLLRVKEVRPGVQMALAVFVGRTRLIDNIRL